jgi:hypothetical protein
MLKANVNEATTSPTIFARMLFTNYQSPIVRNYGITLA